MKFMLLKIIKYSEEFLINIISNILKKGSILTGFTCFLFLGSSQASWATADTNPLSNVIAKIENEIILSSEVEAAYQEYVTVIQKQGRKIELTKGEIFERLFWQKIMLVKARSMEDITKPEAKITATVNKKIEGMIAHIGSKEALVKYFGMSLPKLRALIEREAEETFYLERMQQKLMGETSVTPAEVQSFFESIPLQERPTCPTSVVAYQLIKYPKLSKERRDNIFNKLLALKKCVQQGEDFATLAKTASEDEDTAAEGGEVGFWQTGELDPAYEAAALALKPGEVSDPIETPLGIHLVQLITRKGDGYNSRHILIKPQTEEENLQAAQESLAALRNQLLASNNKGVSLEVLMAAKNQVDAILYLTNNAGGAKVPLADLDEKIQEELERLEPGALTLPLQFTTPDGKQAIRVLYLHQTIPEHPLSLEDDYEMVREMALEHKIGQKQKEWIDKAKKDIFIYVHPDYQAFVP